MEVRRNQQSAVLVLKRDEGFRGPILNPLPPKDPEASPRYACGNCEHVLLTGIPLVELKQRACRGDLAIRCPACDAVNATEVTDTRRTSVRVPDSVPQRRAATRPEMVVVPVEPTTRWHLSGQQSPEDTQPG